MEILVTGFASPRESNKECWLKVPYIWNARVFLYEEYYDLSEKRNQTTNDYIWNDYP